MRLAHGRIDGLLPDEPMQEDADELEEIARARIERARVDLLLDHPYFAAALLAIPMRGTTEQLIANAVVTDGSRIVYRHDLVAALERPRVRMLLMHALLHVLLQHPERGQHREWVLWTTACDIAVDLLFIELGIEQERPREELRRFEGLSAEQIYAELQKANGPSPRPMPSPDDGMMPPPPEAARSTDEPSDRSAERDSFERAMDDSERLAPMQLDRLRRDFQDSASRSSKTECGNRAGTGRAEIDAAAREQICWRRMLSRFMLEPIDREWSYARPNRKHLWRGLYLPGPMEVEGGRFVLAIDTSGSMSDHELHLVLGEADAIRRSCACELTVLQFDAAIHATAEFNRWTESDETVGSTKVMRVFGRGGTDLRLPFNWVEQERRKGRRISALIVCTDGIGPLPRKAPSGLPVLFLLTPFHHAPGFGERVVLSEGRG